MPTIDLADDLTLPTSPPNWIMPQLAALVTQAPDGAGWLHEIKLDGYRMPPGSAVVKRACSHARVWIGPNKYSAVAEAVSKLPADTAYLDGELCELLPDGRTSFNLIQNATDTGEGRWSSTSSICFT